MFENGRKETGYALGDRNPNSPQGSFGEEGLSCVTLHRVSCIALHLASGIALHRASCIALHLVNGVALRLASCIAL